MMRAHSARQLGASSRKATSLGSRLQTDGFADLTAFPVLIVLMTFKVDHSRTLGIMRARERHPILGLTH